MKDFSNYIIKELRDGGIDIEYDGYLKNIHPTKTFYIKCQIYRNFASDQIVLFKILPQSEKLVMSHNCGPVLENDLDFDIIKIYERKPRTKTKIVIKEI